MILKACSASLLALALTLSAVGQTTPPSAGAATHYTQGQLKAMAKEARSPAQFGALAAGYAALQKEYLTKAAEEKQEWERRSAQIQLTAAKYPRPVDSAHYLYDYYTLMAQDAEQRSARYQQLAGSPSPVN
jgi:hypothetical protein